MKRSYKIDRERAHYVFDRLIERLRANGHPFDHSAPPQVKENLPVNLVLGGVEHSLFLWTTCYYMRGGIDSEVAIRQLTLIHERKPYLFQPQWMWDQIPDEIRSGALSYGKELIALLIKQAAYIELRSELSAHGLGFSLEDNTRFWILNALKLKMFWCGDPRRLFEEATSFEILVDRIANLRKFSLDKAEGFMGFQHKMVSMITYFLVEGKLVDPHTIPVPVDFHVLRMLISTEIITPEWEAAMESNIFSPQLLAVAREVTHAYCVEHAVEMIELCDALWLFSRAMCSWHPDNESATPDKSEKRMEQQKLRSDPGRKSLDQIDEPDKKGLGRKSRILHIAPTWSDAQAASFDRACRMCPVVSVCKYAVPAAPYYVKGEVHRRIRSTPPERQVQMLDSANQGHPFGIKIPLVPWNKEAARQAALKFLEMDRSSSVAPNLESVQHQQQPLL